MANTLQATKRARQAEKRGQRNAAGRSAARTFLKKTLAAIEAGELEQAREFFREAQKRLDKLVSRGIMHKNKVARYKLRLHKKIKALDLAQTA